MGSSSSLGTAGSAGDSGLVSCRRLPGDLSEVCCALPGVGDAEVRTFVHQQSPCSSTSSMAAGRMVGVMGSWTHMKQNT